MVLSLNGIVQWAAADHELRACPTFLFEQRDQVIICYKSRRSIWEELHLHLSQPMLHRNIANSVCGLGSLHAFVTSHHHRYMYIPTTSRSVKQCSQNIQKVDCITQRNGIVELGISVSPDATAQRSNACIVCVREKVRYKVTLTKSPRISVWLEEVST